MSAEEFVNRFLKQSYDTDTSYLPYDILKHLYIAMFQLDSPKVCDYHHAELISLCLSEDWDGVFNYIGSYQYNYGIYKEFYYEVVAYKRALKLDLLC